MAKMSMLEKVIKELEPQLSAEMSLSSLRKKISFVRLNKADANMIIKEMQKKKFIDIEKNNSCWMVKKRK